MPPKPAWSTAHGRRAARGRHLPALGHARQRALRHARRWHWLLARTVAAGDRTTVGAAARRNDAWRRDVLGNRAAAWACRRLTAHASSVWHRRDTINRLTVGFVEDTAKFESKLGADNLDQSQRTNTWRSGNRRARRHLALRPVRHQGGVCAHWAVPLDFFEHRAIYAGTSISQGHAPARKRSAMPMSIQREFPAGN